MRILVLLRMKLHQGPPNAPTPQQSCTRQIRISIQNHSDARGAGFGIPHFPI